MVTRAMSALAKVCGDVRDGTDAEGVLGVVPKYVATPANVTEAAEVMRVAAERGLTVVPRGAENRLDWGAPPRGCDLLVDTAGLDRVMEHAAGDLVVTVEAGVTMERLAEVLATEGQRLALDVPLPGSTIGGTIATGAAGPSRLLYGSVRDLLIGVTVVRADGVIAKAGGKVVKNVAGYDLGKLYAGSYGTLGLIALATFRLHPIPAARAYVTCEVPAAEAPGRVQSMLHSLAVPSAIEVDAPQGGPATVAVLLEGVPEGIEPRTTEVVRLLNADARISPQPPDWWGAYPGGDTLVEISARPGAFPSVQGSARWSGTGKGYLGIPCGTPGAEVAALLDGLRRDRAVTAVVRYAPEAVRDEIDLWGPVPALALMKRVKDQFDPEHRLSPGRFAGGI